MGCSNDYQLPEFNDYCCGHHNVIIIPTHSLSQGITDKLDKETVDELIELMDAYAQRQSFELAAECKKLILKTIDISDLLK